MLTSATEAVSIHAPPGVVLDFVGDPLELPRWAPAFARSVRRDQDAWIVDTGTGEVRIDVRVCRGQGTVDFLAADTPAGVDRGAFCRVVPNGAGSEFLFTQFFPEAATEADVAGPRAVVREELEVVRAICEHISALARGETPEGATTHSARTGD